MTDYTSNKRLNGHQLVKMEIPLWRTNARIEATAHILNHNIGLTLDTNHKGRNIFSYWIILDEDTYVFGVYIYS